MRTGRPKGTPQSPEAREKISRANVARWQDPEYRARQLQRLSDARDVYFAKCAATPKPPRPGRAKSAETIEKIRATLKRRWQEPEFRARHLPHTLAIQAVAAKLHPPPVRGAVRPPKGTPERGWYRKVVEILGPAAAKSLNWSAGTEGAGRP
jgi:hypothetical protein